MKIFFIYLTAIFLLGYVYLSLTDFGSTEYHNYLAFFSGFLYLMLLYNWKYDVFKDSILRIIKVFFVWMMIISLIFPERLFNISLTLFFQSTLWCPLFFIIYKFTTRKPEILLRRTKQFFYFLMFFSGIIFITTEIETRNVYLSYYAVASIPWILLIKNKYLKYFGLSFILFTTILAGKRGGLIAATAAIVSYFFIDSRFSKRNNGINTVKLLISIAFISILIILLVYNLDSNVFIRLGQIDEDKGSGRIDLYDELIILISNFDTYNFIVGNGHNATYTATGNFAHNEFIQFFFDYGLIGFLSYIYLHIVLLKKCSKLFKGKSPYAASFIASYIIFITIAMVSHWFVMALFVVTLISYWAVIFALTNQNRKIYYIYNK